MNAVVLPVVFMPVLAVPRVHVVLALFAGAPVGWSGGRPRPEGHHGRLPGLTWPVSYALLTACAMAVADSGPPRLLADWFSNRFDHENADCPEGLPADEPPVAGWITAVLPQLPGIKAPCG